MIKNLIFDWGGVLTLGTHTSKIKQILEDEHDVSFQDRKGIVYFMDLIDSNNVSFEEFLTLVNKEYDLNILEYDMFRIFERAIKPSAEMISLIKQIKMLKQKYRILMISNNSETTVSILKNKHEGMLGLFEKIYFSYELGMLKPDKRVFELVLGENNLKPEECMLIDDMEENIIAAGKLGMNGIVFKDCNQLKQELKEMKIHI
jgi:putative hydrolase of the HAD superfamily